MPEDYRYDDFLSHSSKDKAVVRRLPERLRKDWAQLESGTSRFDDLLHNEHRFTLLRCP